MESKGVVVESVVGVLEPEAETVGLVEEVKVGVVVALAVDSTEVEVALGVLLQECLAGELGWAEVVTA